MPNSVASKRTSPWSEVGPGHCGVLWLHEQERGTALLVCKDCTLKTKCLCSWENAASRLLLARLPRGRGRGAAGGAGAPRGLQPLTFSSHHWQGRAFPYSETFGILLCALFCQLWVGAFFFFFFMALHEKYSIKFCILLQGFAEPNPKSAERVWSCLSLSPHIRCFFEGCPLWA